MRLKTSVIAAIGLGSLVALIAISMLALAARAQTIYAQLDALNAHHRSVDSQLRRLRSDVTLSGIFVRDYLLDVVRERAPEYREQIAEFRRTNMATLAELTTSLQGDARVTRLQGQLDEYWAIFEPLFNWTTTEKILRSTAFLRREVVPRREAALRIAQEIEELNNANAASQRAEVARRQAAFRDDLYRLLWQTLLLGLAVAVGVVVRLSVLERRSERAEKQMRQLSQQLVHTQEEERKSLARELHDHVAQVLTGLRMELGRIERGTAPVAAAVAECKKLVDEMFDTVRGLALGLRPSMLDDFGLQAALEWHVRDFMRRYAINVDLNISGDLGVLSEKHRTCVYRVVQEAMTNCVRHAEAKQIAVDVSSAGHELRVSVSDDGVGVERTRTRGGLGLRGIEERVRELDGSMTIDGERGRGTTIVVRLPMALVTSEVSFAGAGS